MQCVVSSVGCSGVTCEVVCSVLCSVVCVLCGKVWGVNLMLI